MVQFDTLWLLPIVLRFIVSVSSSALKSTDCRVRQLTRVLRPACRQWRACVDDPTLWKLVCANDPELSQLKSIRDWKSTYIALRAPPRPTFPHRLRADRLQFIVEIHIRWGTSAQEEEGRFGYSSVLDGEQAFHDLDACCLVTECEGMMRWDLDKQGWGMTWCPGYWGQEDIEKTGDPALKAQPWALCVQNILNDQCVQVKFACTVWCPEHQILCRLFDQQSEHTPFSLIQETSQLRLGITHESIQIASAHNCSSHRCAQLHSTLCVDCLGRIKLWLRSPDYTFADCSYIHNSCFVPERLLPPLTEDERRLYEERYYDDRGCGWMLQNLSWRPIN